MSQLMQILTWPLRAIRLIVFVAAAGARMLTSNSVEVPPNFAGDLLTSNGAMTNSRQIQSPTLITYHPEYHHFRPAMVDASLAAAASLGVGYIRSDVRWRYVFPDGVHVNEQAFAWYRVYFKAARDRYGLHAIIVLGDPPPTLKGQSEDALLSAWAIYVQEVVKRLGDICDFYQILNEPNNPVYRLYSADRVCAAVSIAASAIRSRDIHAVLSINVATDLSNWKWWLEQILRGCGSRIDVIGLDHYPGTWTTSAPSDWRDIRNFLTEVKSAKPDSIWFDHQVAIMETGFSTNVPWLRGEKQQVSFFDAFDAELQLEGDRIGLVGFYELSDRDSRAILDPEAHFGLVTSDRLTPKAAFARVREICSRIRAGSPRRDPIRPVK